MGIKTEKIHCSACEYLRAEAGLSKSTNWHFCDHPKPLYWTPVYGWEPCEFNQCGDLNPHGDCPNFSEKK